MYNVQFTTLRKSQNYTLLILHSTFRASRGFTLVEILVVVGIIALLFTLGFAAYREFDRRQRLAEAVNLVKADMLLAQQKALSGEKPSECTTPPPKILNGFIFRFDTSSSYQIIADCGNLGYDVSDPVVKSSVITPGVTKTAGPTSVTFKVLARGTTSSSDDVFTLSLGGGTIAITVTPTGSVY